MKTNETKVIHYHKDTEELAAQLVKESIYDTNKGKCRFKMRSQSNGKLMFLNLGTNKNIYFTKQEWVDGGNSIKKIIADFKVQPVIPNTTGSAKSITSGLLPTKSKLQDVSLSPDPFAGKYAKYHGIHNINGIKVQYEDSGSTVVYFLPDEFKRRFKVVEVGSMTAKELAALNKPSIVEVPKKKRKSKR